MVQVATCGSLAALRSPSGWRVVQVLLLATGRASTFTAVPGLLKVVQVLVNVMPASAGRPWGRSALSNAHGPCHRLA
jgi:hypothetical protein